MKVYNNSNIEQSIKITDRYGKVYAIYLPANRSTVLEPNQVSKDVIDLINQGVLLDVTSEEVISTSSPTLYQPNLPITVSNVDKDDSSDDPLEESTNNQHNLDDKDIDTSTETLNTSSCVCKYCGNEFASQRGLTMHINKTHLEEINKEE